MKPKERMKVESRKTWNAPQLIVHGDVEKITKEGPNIGPNFARGYGSM